MLIDVDTNNSTDASELFIVEEIIVEISGEVQQIIYDKCEKIKETNSAPVLQNKKSSRTKEITYACPRQLVFLRKNELNTMLLLRKKPVEKGKISSFSFFKFCSIPLSKGK